MRKFLLLLFLFPLLIVNSQHVDTSYARVSDNIETQEGATSYRKRWYFGSFEFFVFSEIMEEWREKKRYEREREQSIAKLAILQQTWRDVEKFPDTITDGWHNAVATDQVNYYKVVKAMVKGNKVKRVIYDNYIPISFISANEIKKAKNTLTLENRNQESLEVMQLYFLFDLDEPVIVPEPIHAGYLCLWTDLRTYKSVKLKVDGRKYNKPFTDRIIGDRDCFSEGMFCLCLKPGKHHFIAQTAGHHPPVKDRDFVIKPDMCLHYRIGNRKRAKK